MEQRSIAHDRGVGDVTLTFWHWSFLVDGVVDAVEDEAGVVFVICHGGWDEEEKIGGQKLPPFSKRPALIRQFPGIS